MDVFLHDFKERHPETQNVYTTKTQMNYHRLRQINLLNQKEWCIFASELLDIRIFRGDTSPLFFLLKTNDRSRKNKRTGRC